MKLLHPMRLTRAVGVLCIALHVQACGFFEPSRMSSASRSTPVAGSAPASSPAPVARVPVDPRAPTYTVQRGDNLYRIALDHGQAWRDLAAWNNLEDPGKIEVGQVLRVLPPEGGAQSTPVASAPVVVAKPLGSTPVPTPMATGSVAAIQPVASTINGSGTANNPPTQVAKAAESAAPSVEDDGITFAWPVRGSVLEGFNDPKNRGIDIGGKAGDPVLAAADGKVVYAANGLRGYGNLIILKHNNSYLTAYAHNQALLVKENQTIKKGQKIAEMGATDAERVKLHFEIRRLGKPVDPMRFLPEKP